MFLPLAISRPWFEYIKVVSCTVSHSSFLMIYGHFSWLAPIAVLPLWSICLQDWDRFIVSMEVSFIGTLHNALSEQEGIQEIVNNLNLICKWPLHIWKDSTAFVFMSEWLLVSLLFNCIIQQKTKALKLGSVPFKLFSFLYHLPFTMCSAKCGNT